MKKIKPPSYKLRKDQDKPNKKLILWISSIVGFVIVASAVLLIVNG